MIGSELLRYKPDQKFLIFDKETEGLNLFSSRPWQISYAICTVKEILDIKVRHIHWPDLYVSDQAARVTRFNMASHLRIAEDPEVVLKDFEALALDPQYILAGHNILGYDIYVWETWRRLISRTTDWSYLPRILDTNCLMKAYKKGFAPSGDRLTWQYKLLDYREKGLKSNLGVCAKEFKIPYDETRAHDAKYDTQINHAVLNKLIWAVEI